MIKDYLRRGSDNVISAKDLQRITGYTSKRRMTKEIERERCEGALILSNARGYYLPENQVEINRYIRSMERRAKSIFRVIKNAKLAAGYDEAQITLQEYMQEGGDYGTE